MTELPSTKDLIPQTAEELSVIRFTNAFNSQRPTLAKFATASSLTELHLIRDTFFLNMASDLCQVESNEVKSFIVEKFRTSTEAGFAPGFAHTIMFATASPDWGKMIAALNKLASDVGSDLNEIWMTLEKGRMEWLGALVSSHKIRVTLRKALEEGGGTEDDSTDGLMVWIYALSLSIPALERERENWSNHVRMTDKNNPLKNYSEELWDPRIDLWRELELGVKAAADRGGGDILECWMADTGVKQDAGAKGKNNATE